MRLCGYYDEDGDDVGLGRPQCARDPYYCTYFRPNKYNCPFMKYSGGYNKRKIAEWRRWREKQKISNEIHNIIGIIIHYWYFSIIILMLILATIGLI